MSSPKRSQLKAQNGSWTETHCESPAIETPETDISRPDYCSKSCPSAVDLAGRNNRLLIPILLYNWLALISFKKSPQFRIAHIKHFKSLKSDFPVLDKTMYNEANKSILGVSLKRFQEWFHQFDEDVDKVEDPKPKAKKEGLGKSKAWSNRNRKFEAHQTKFKSPIRIPTSNAKEASVKKRPQASMEPPGPGKRFKANHSKPSTCPSRRSFERELYITVTNVIYKVQCRYSDINCLRCFIEY